MALSNIDFITPKITLYYNGRNSHISRVGGLLSLFFLIVIIILIFYIICDLLKPEISSSIIYEQITNNKIFQPIDYSGINHFIQIYSHTGNGWFGDLDKKNIIIYSIRENQTMFYDNINLNITNTEHWLYDKCENVYEISKNLFPDISKEIPNYTKSICLRFYYNPSTMQYYEIGFDGYVSPKLETNEIFEKKYIYKIIIEKCVNNSFISNKFGYTCNTESEINSYLNIYTEIFTYFLNNQLIPDNYKYPLENNFFSVSSTMNENTYFENNIIFSPFKLITEKQHFFEKKRENISYVLNNHYSYNNILYKKKSKIIGVFNFYLSNNIIVYHRKYISLLDTISHLGGLSKILFFIFQIINYLNYRYTILEHTKDLFQINTGIDSNVNYSEGNDFFFDKRHMTNHNYKIKVFNNNNIINTEDISHKITKNYYPSDKKKFKFHNQKSSKKNIFLYPFINNNNSNNQLKKTFLSKRSQTKYLSNENDINKKFKLKTKDGKRKSYLSQGYRAPKENNNSIGSKNQSYVDNDLSNNDIISNNERRSIICNSNLVYLKEGTSKFDGPPIRASNENNSIKIKKESKKFKYKKNNIKNPSIDRGENITKLLFKNLDSNNKTRHKSVNYSNQRKILENNNTNNSLNNKYGIGKDSSGYINESSKQVLLNNNKSIFTLHNSKFQVENRYDNYSRIPTLINNNDFFINNINNAFNNSMIDPTIFLKNLIHNKLKFHFPEGKKTINFFGFVGKKINYFDFIKSLFSFRRKNENKLELINKFRTKLLSEEHLYRAFINLYLIEKIFQIEEALKFDINEMYSNL